MSYRRRLPRFLAALTTTATVLTVGAVAPASAAPAPKPTTSGRSAKAPAGDAAWYTTEAEAMVAARRSGKRIEVDALTTETRQIFANPHGTFTLEQRVRPVRVKRNNRWVPVDPTLRFGAGGRVTPRATKVGLSFSGGGDTVLARVVRDGRELEFGWDKPLPRPTLDGDTATYPNVLPDVDLVVKADVEGFSEVFVVHTPEAASNPALTTADFALRTKGLNVTTDVAGNIKALDADGRMVLTAPTPRMWDSGGTAEPGLSAGERTFQSNLGARQAAMKPTIRNGTLSITPDRAMLRAADTRYPVYLDPSLVSGSRLAWTSVWKSFPNSKYWNSSDIARVGYSQTDNLTNRSFFRMDTSRVKGKNIIRATFQAYETHSWSCNARSVELWRTGAISSATTWNSQPSWIAKLDTVNVARGYSSSCPDGGVDFDATAGVRTAAAAKAGDVTLGLRATSETDTLAWKKFRNNPTLSIEYNSTPSVPTALSTSPGTPCTGGKLGNTDVYLRATPSDADGGNVVGEFSLWPTGGATTVRNVTVSSGVQARTLFLKSSLTDGVTYNWRVRTKDSDGAASGYSATCSFTVDKTLPTADVDVTSTQYPAQDPAGTIVSTVPAGIPGQFTINAKGNTDVIGFYVGIDTDTPSRYVAANTPGGTATVTMTPTRSGPGFVAVKTWDGVNPSASVDTDHAFFATAPAGPQAGRNDLNTDGHGDLIGRNANGDLCLYLGNGAGGFIDGSACSVKIDSNRSGWLHVVRPGDWDGDGWTDLVAVEADGDLVYFTGNGSGGFLPDANDVIIDWDADDNPIRTTGWNQYNLVVAPGDWDGDGYPDLIARKSTGEIVLHRGNGFGGWADDAAPVRLGWGIWQGFDSIVAPGDVDGDGKADLFARKANGELTLFRGNGKAGFRSPGGVRYGVWQTGVNVRAANATCDASPSVANCPTVVDTLNPGDLILPICQKRGEYVGGNPYWVYGTTPRGKTGWVHGYNIDYTENQLPDVPNCARPAQTTYTVWTDGVIVTATNATCEGAPSTTNCATVIDTLFTGSMFTPICQRTGQTVSGNPYWVYGISSNGQTGWMPAWWMDYPDNRLPNLALCANYNGSSVGTGWSTYSAGLFAAGDFNDDGRNDLMGVKSTGDLHVYYGTGNGTNLFSNGNGGTKIGTGWNGFNKVF
ncbi:FG-GAP-like repeat-containing protein [Micromonospora wenchangensis]|uniref:FG-GAP-like repeat-containing protein n=1 Tax=Micromonospora wenchangensis TaxID=1185415 RepID=UPI003D71645B